MEPTSSSFPRVTGTTQREINILLINPNSSKSMTEACLRSVAPTLPVHVTVHGFTPSQPAPSAVEGRVDGILSSAECLRAIIPIASQYDAFLVACFSAHPLITALREEVTQPVIGIMEAALYASRMCGAKLGVITTSQRSKLLHQKSINDYGFAEYSAGCEAANVAVLELESKPKEEVYSGLVDAAHKLVNEKEADCICLGCAGMTEMRMVCEKAVGMDERQVMVVDGVGMGVHFLASLVRENLGTAKRGEYRSAALGREKRNQDWL